MSQLALFPDQAAGPKGLRYAREFVSRETERDLISRIAQLPLQPFQFGAFEGKRRVASFGFKYDYTLQRLQAAKPIPDWLGTMVARVEEIGRAHV